MTAAFHLVELFLLFTILYRQSKQKERLTEMATEAELDAKLVELKQEIANAAQRVIDKINKIIAGQPDLTDELTDVVDDIEKLKAIAPAEPPPQP